MSTTSKLSRYFCYQTRITYRFKNRANIVLPKSFGRSIHINTKLNRKMFLEYENRYAYNIMNNNGYAVTLPAATKSNSITLTKESFDDFLQEDHSKKSPTQLFEGLSRLGSYSAENGLCISNKMFDSFIDALTDNVNQASDQELRLLFYYLLQWPETESIRTRNFIEVWAALDDECLNRIKIWSYDDMLSFMAMFYMLNVTRYSDFINKCLNKLASKASQLTPKQLVQTLFFIGIVRRSPYDMHNLELVLEKLFEEFTIDELAIMSMGFFKTKTPVRNMELISKIIDKITENAKSIHEVSLAALLKIIRYSMKLDTNNKIYKLLDALQYEVPRLSLMCNVHLALLGTATLTLHQSCLTEIAKLTLSNLNEARMKDLERLVFVFGSFNVKPNTTECFFQRVVEELGKPERLPEIEQHGRSFACCVAYLSHLGIFPIHLITKVLSPEFLNNVYGKQIMAYGREILTINNSTKIFCPEYNLHWLSDKSALLLAKKYTDFVPNEQYKKQYNVSEKFMLDVIKTLKEFRGGEEYVTGDHILTHHQRGDVIVCNDRNGTPVKVTECFNSAGFGKLRRAPDENNWVALVIAGRNAIIQATDNATGPFLAKVRELEALGYHAALVTWSKYSILDTKESKIDYLNKLIDESITNNNKSKFEIKIL